jgi:hypothetical protein
VAKKPSFLDQLYPGRASVDTDPFAVPVGSVLERLTGQKTLPKGRRRDLNVRISRAPTISTPRPNTLQRVSDALRTVGTGGVGQALDAGEALTGVGSLYDSAIRGARQVGYGDAYTDNPDLQEEDARNLIINGLFGAAGPLGKGALRVARRIPGVDSAVNRAVNYLREVPGGRLVDPDYIEGAFSVRPPAAAEMAVPRLTGPAPAVAELAVPRLTGPARPLALPAPGPGLPPLASKPRGGQFWTDRMYAGTNMSPELAARRTRENAELGAALGNWEPEDYGVVNMGGAVPQTAQLGDWLERTLAKYYKTDFGAPEDPLRSLAERGLHYDPEMTPERWRDTVNSYLQEDTIGDVLLPPARRGAMPGAGNELRAAAMLSMPWLAKQPVTDNIYGIGQGGLDLSHFTDEMRNAMDVASSGLPADLAVRPESLQRMTFPQAVEQVGKINQYRAKEMERAALDAQNNPVTHVFKEYADDNPMGLKWVEMAPPKGDGPTNYDVKDELGKALKYEGDTMGHCVGGYCPDVMSGKSRIFSLRDAKGEPHVTVETSPVDPNSAAVAHLRALGVYPDWVAHLRDNPRGRLEDTHALGAKFLEARGLPPTDYSGQDIIQIKGKGNRAPKDDYLPFVQDFVKSGQWGNVGDLRNTQLVKLPDGRYITQQQYDDVVRGDMLDDNYQSYDFSARGFPRDPSGMAPEDWQQFSRHFEGYAIGGRVSADRCFTRHPLSAKG